MNDQSDEGKQQPVDSEFVFGRDLRPKAEGLEFKSIKSRIVRAIAEASASISRIESLPATYIKATYIKATYIRATYVKATYIKATYIKATYIKATYIKATYIKATYIKSGF